MKPEMYALRQSKSSYCEFLKYFGLDAKDPEIYGLQRASHGSFHDIWMKRFVSMACSKYICYAKKLTVYQAAIKSRDDPLAS